MKITKQQKLILLGIEALTKKHLAIMEDLLDSATEILGDRDYTSDFIYGARTLDETIKILSDD